LKELLHQGADNARPPLYRQVSFEGGLLASLFTLCKPSTAAWADQLMRVFWRLCQAQSI